MANRFVLKLQQSARVVVVFFLGTTLLAQTGGRETRQSEGRGSVAPGAAVTLLSDGRLLMSGGLQGAAASDVLIVLDSSGASSRLAVRLREPRVSHSATVLPDGRLLILGGTDAKGRPVQSAEIYDPGADAIVQAQTELMSRAGHTATVLGDGRVLIAGGRDQDGNVTAVAEVWDPGTGAVSVVGEGLAPRSGHSATLMGDGTVLIEGGVDGAGNPVAPELFLPDQAAFVAASVVRDRPDGPMFSGSIPANGAFDVPVALTIAIRFTGPVTVGSATSHLFELAGSGAAIPVRVVAAEGGRLFFVHPTRELEFGTNYTLSAGPLREPSGGFVPMVAISFTTTRRERDAERGSKDDDEMWVPEGTATWESGRAPSSWQELAPLQAAPGMTALAAQVLTLNGKPLSRVAVGIGGVRSITDDSGRFLLAGVSAGRQELVVDARPASRPGRRYGFFMIAVDVNAGQTTALLYTIWMPVLDTAHEIPLPAGGSADFIARTPRIPGLEVHIPAGGVLRDADGNIAQSMTITPIPVDRAPFPLPVGVRFPVYFTLQPGGARLEGSASAVARGMRLVFPNASRQRPGTRIDFWSYDSKQVGWFRYGQGTVGADSRTVTPDPGVVIRHFTCASIGDPNDFPSDGPKGLFGGDPVDLATGLFVYDKVDLVLPDSMPIAFGRTYRQGDPISRAFGIGTTHSYELNVVGDRVNYSYAELVLPDGARFRFDRTSSGTSHTTAVMEHTATPTQFLHSVLSWNSGYGGWDLRLRDGTVYEFFVYWQAEVAVLQAVQDRFGNRVSITRDANRRATHIRSPHGRSLQLTYDGSGRVTQIADQIGRTVAYTYDASGRLWKVTDAASGVTELTYDTSHRMQTIKDPRGITYLTNVYDANGRMSEQTLADGGVFEFDYTLDLNNRIIQTDLTDPRGFVRRVTFNAYGYAQTDTLAFGQAEEQATTLVRASTTNLVTSHTDELNRQTTFGYDSLGNLTTMTRLAGTASAVTTTLTYEPAFNQVASVVDPLIRTTTFAYDSRGALVSVTDPLNHATTFGRNGVGQIVSMTDATSKTVQLGYQWGDLVSVQTPLGHSSTQFLDAAGRLLWMTDPSGNRTSFQYDNFNQVTKIIDSRGGETTFTYDGNGNRLTLTDARGKTTTWTYDNMDRVATRTDPLTRQETFTYDLHGNLKTWTDRKGQVTAYAYDALDRQTFVGFGATGAPPIYASSITTTYDAGNRATEIVDSVAGTIEHTYDLLDRLTEETTPEGTVTYTYDADGRRTTMTVAGQTAVEYTYDNSDRLTGVSQGTASVAMTHDNANRRMSLTLPNGIVVEYAYDDDSRPTSLTYKQGGSTVGNLTYTYDGAGQRTSVGGTYARTGLPAALTSATYDDANQIATFGDASFTCDDNGNLTSDGVRSYTWDVRNQLASLSGPVNASFAYDAFGRRRGKTVGSTTTGFVYDGPNPVQELSGSTVMASVLTGLGVDEYFTRTDASGVRNYLTDALGTSVALTDGTGTVQTEYTYEPFGGTTTSGATTSNTFGFTGREADGTGLYFYRARYYDPRLQRFIAEDPLGFGAGDANLHGYVFNAPTNFTDPSGEFALLVLPAAGCVGGALGMGMSSGWNARKLAAGCAFGAMIGLGAWAAGPMIAPRAFGGAGAGAGSGAGYGGAAAGAGRAGASAAAAGAQRFSKGEVAGLRELFGRSQQGIAELLERLNSGRNVPLPNGVTPETLSRYREIAEQAIRDGKDALGVQAKRIVAIDELLRRMRRRGGR